MRTTSLVLLAIVASTAARADVFEVGAGGALLVRSGAGAVVWSGAEEVADLAGAEAAPEVPGAAVTSVGASDAPLSFQAGLLQAASRYQVSPALLSALVWQESRWQPGALSPKGAVGLGQLMPATARALAVDPREPGANLEGAAHYLRQLLDLFDGDVERALAAYNAGPARVLKAGGVPAITETRAYVARIMARLAGTQPANSTPVTLAMGAAR